MPRGEPARRSARGFAFLGLLALVALVGLLLGAGVEVAATASRREQEAQLLWVGHEYRAAIGRYWRHHHAYPQALEELLGTPADAPLQARYLRRIYRDPMTRAADWVLVPSPIGGFMGVASRSTRAPLKSGGFDEVDRDFAGASSYGDWRFTFEAVARRRAP